MSAEAAFTRSWRVGMWVASLTCRKPQAGQDLAAVIEWTPNRPHRLSAGELQQYRAGRDAAMAELAAELGITVGVIET